MASGGSLQSSIATVTDGEEYISAQEDVESVSRTLVEAMEENGDGNDARDATEETDSELDINELTVFIPKLPQSQIPVLPQTPSIRPTAKSTKHRLQIMEHEHAKSQIRKILCGVLILLIMFGIAALMIFLALMFNVDDLFIIAGIFVFGGTIFTIGFIIVRCSTVLPYDKADIEAAREELSGMHSSTRRDASTPTFEF